MASYGRKWHGLTHCGLWLLVLWSLTSCTAIQSTTAPADSAAASSGEPVQLRLAVALTPQELASFQASLTALQANHPEWEILLEAMPQQSETEKLNTQLAAGNLPDVIRVNGLIAHRWIRQNAFLDLSDYVDQHGLNLDDFYPGPLAQFRWQDHVWAIPDVAAPDVVFYNRTMFDTAGLDHPTSEWTFDDMRNAAIALTLDDQGRTPLDPAFDPEKIVQWGWNGGLTHFWQRHLVRGFGGDFCDDANCTPMKFTTPATVDAVTWWAEMTHVDHATLYDPYGGSQTGIPGDPFIGGKAAMGFNGFFAVGQLNDLGGSIDYDIVEPFLGRDGARYTPLSTFGYVIAGNSENPAAAWALIEALTSPDFLSTTWGEPGHAVPARRSAAASVINADRAPDNQQAILNAMDYGDVFVPYTASVFEVYAKTAPIFADIMRGERLVAEGLAEIEQTANEILAADR